MSRGVLRCALLLACAAFACLTFSSTALGFSARGHQFAFSFAAPGPVRGVAVDEATGHVYVALGRNAQAGCALGCVDELEVSPGGEAKLVRTLEAIEPRSVAVDNAASSPSYNDVYAAGETKKAAKEEEEEATIVYKFGATGSAPIAKFKKFKIEKGEAEKFEEIEGLAVDSTGKLLVYDGGEDAIARFSSAEKNKSLTSVESAFGTPSPGLAVDSQGNVLVGHESETPGAGGPNGEPPVVGKCEIVEAEHECEALIGELNQESTAAVAADGGGEVFLVGNASVNGQPVTSLSAYSVEGSLIQRLSAPGLTRGSAVAVNSSSGSIYVSDAASGTVDVFTPEPPGAPQVDSFSACLTTRCNPESAGVRLTATVDPTGLDTKAYFEFGTSSCASSPCEKTAETDLGEGFGDQTLAAELGAVSGVTYHFRVVVSNSQGSLTTAEKTITIPATATSLPDGRAWEMVSPPEKDGFEAESIPGPGGVIEAAANGSAVAYTADGPIHCEGEPEGSRSPEPAEILAVRGSTHWGCQDLSTANSAGIGANVGLPREYQAFTPNLSVSLVQPFPGPGESEQWADPALSPPVSEHEKALLAEGKPYQEKTVYLRDDAPLQPEASRSEEVSNYAAAQSNGTAMGNAGFVSLVNEANALGVLEKPPGCEEGLCFGGGKASDVEVVTGTPDLSHVLIKSNKASLGVYEWSAGKLQLTSRLPKNEQGEELPASGVSLPGRMPNVRNAISENGERVFWSNENGAVSHLYLRDLEKRGGVETPETIQLDQSQEQEFTPVGFPNASFQTASVDGSRVFFTDTQRLTARSKAAGGGGKKTIRPDLYVYELGPGSAAPGKLTDLTPEGIYGESAGVVSQQAAGGVIGASEDGTYVYFVADGALVKGASPGNCEVSAEEAAPTRSCNLYEMHLNGEGTWETKLIAVLSNVDSPDWGGAGFQGQLGNMTARVSPNGRFVAFMSSRSLTGYDNEDQTSKAPGEKMDEEVYLFDANQETLTCASCNPSGARPAGVFDPGKESEGKAEGIGLVVDNIGTWGQSSRRVDHWLAGSVPGWTPVSIERSLYQSRYLSNSGRLFFDSPDHLVPAATGVMEKVYEYEPTSVGSCTSGGGCIGLLSSPNSENEPTGEHESAFVDASENGEDVFFVTAAKLPAVNGATGDVDSNYDVYDARVCQQPGSPGSGCLPGPSLGSPGCANEAGCKTAAPGLPASPPPASMTASASGNVAHIGTLPSKEESKKPTPPKKLTKAQLLSKALKACRTKYKGHSKKKQREKCEARAHKKYGHAASHKKSHKASRASHGSAR